MGSSNKKWHDVHSTHVMVQLNKINFSSFFSLFIFLTYVFLLTAHFFLLYLCFLAIFINRRHRRSPKNYLINNSVLNLMGLLENRRLHLFLFWRLIRCLSLPFAFLAKNIKIAFNCKINKC